MMKVFILAALLVSAVLAAPRYQPSVYNYHEELGIPKAALIKASEEASDFDGARIIGGSHASLGQFPYMAGLIITLTTGSNSACGASLLNNRRLLTAAHCWFDGHQQARTMTVVLGSTRLFQGGTRINTNQVQMHAQYNVATIANDIAMIMVPHVGFTNNIRPINIASGSATYAGQTATAVGFGITGPGHQITQNQALNFVNLPVIANQQCSNHFGSRFVIASTICTWGQTGRNICSSDSGGPLAIGNTLIGVTSFGANVCGSNAPAAYARVTSFNAWIRQRL